MLLSRSTIKFKQFDKISSVESQISITTNDLVQVEIMARALWPLCLATGGRVFVAGIFIPIGNHYFQALASTLQFVAQVCDRLWLVPATDRAFAYITYMSPPHVALVCSGPPQKRGHLWLNKVASVLGPIRKSDEFFHENVPEETSRAVE